MNRARRHVYLVMSEKIHKQAKRGMQSQLSCSNAPLTISIDDLVKVLNEAMIQNAEATMKVLLEDVMEVSE